MSIITSTPATSVNDPQLRAIAQSVLQTAQLSAQKAALNHADPKRFPSHAAPNGFENAFKSLINALPPKKQQELKARTLAAVEAPAAPQAKTGGGFPGAELQSLASAGEGLYDSLRPGVVLEGARRVIGEDGDWPPRGGDDRWPPTRGGGGATGTQPIKRLLLQLHKVKCVKDTPEWFKDEFLFSGAVVSVTTVDGAPVTSPQAKIEPFKVGSFKKGQEKLFQNKVLYAYDLPKAEQFPVGLNVNIAAYEEDQGNFDSIRQVLKLIEDKVVEELVKLGKDLKGFLGKLTELVTKLLPGLMVKIFDFITRLLADDPFDLNAISVSVSSPDSGLPGNASSTPQETVSLLMKGGKHGRYEVVYSWRLN